MSRLPAELSKSSEIQLHVDIIVSILSIFAKLLRYSFGHITNEEAFIWGLDTRLLRTETTRCDAFIFILQVHLVHKASRFF